MHPRNDLIGVERQAHEIIKAGRNVGLGQTGDIGQQAMHRLKLWRQPAQLPGQARWRVVHKDYFRPGLRLQVRRLHRIDSHVDFAAGLLQCGQYRLWVGGDQYGTARWAQHTWRIADVADIRQQ